MPIAIIVAIIYVTLETMLTEAKSNLHHALQQQQHHHRFLTTLQDHLSILEKPIQVIGEVTTGNMSFHASFQQKDGQRILSGLHNFPLSYAAAPGYCGWPNHALSPTSGFNLTHLAVESERQWKSHAYSNTDLLMNMVSSQDDGPIFGMYRESAGPFSPGTGGCKAHESLVLNAWAWLMFAKGMPAVTWGDEQGNTEYRNSLWQFGWNRSAWQYQLLSKMNAIRRRNRLETASAKVHYGDEHIFVFQRLSGEGSGVWIFTNNLHSVHRDQTVVYPVAPPPAPRGMIWQDALFRQPFAVEAGQLETSSSRPLVLTLEYEVMTKDGLPWKIGQAVLGESDPVALCFNIFHLCSRARGCSEVFLFRFSSSSDLPILVAQMSASCASPSRGSKAALCASQRLLQQYTLTSNRTREEHTHAATDRQQPFISDY